MSNHSESELESIKAQLQGLLTAIQAGPPPVIGFEQGGERQRAFDKGWNENANRLWAQSAGLRKLFEHNGNSGE